MRVTNKTLYALTTLTDLAFQQANSTKPTTVAALSARHSLSTSYIESLFRTLRLAGLVDASRGYGGGYGLAKPASSITAADVMLAVETFDDPAGELAFKLAGTLHDATLATFSKLTLAELAADSGLTKEEEPPVVDSKVVQHRSGVLCKRAQETPVRVDAPNSVFALGAHLARR